MMKKSIALLLSALLLLSVLAGCGGKAETPKDAPSADITVTAPPAPTAKPAAEAPAATQAPAPATPPQGPFTPDGSVLFEMDGVKVTSAGLDDDPAVSNGSFFIWVDVENSGARDLYLGLQSGAVNGFMNDLYLILCVEEDGSLYGSDYAFGQTVPAGESARYALGSSGSGFDAIDLSVPGEITLCFSLAEDEFDAPYYVSEPVTIVADESYEAVDISALGTAVIDNETLLLVIGEQDYDDWFGPTVSVFAENRTGNYLGLVAETAEADGVFCDYIYGTTMMAPHMKSAGFMSFEGDIAEMPGFETLLIDFSLYEAESEKALNDAEGVSVGPLEVTYPPQIWGSYENGGCSLEIRPRINDLLTVQTPADDPDGILFTVSETASLTAGSFEGAGWLFSIGAVDADALHEMLCYDMSGAEVFATDENGNYYIYYHPTDVRYERATPEEMNRDIGQWSMLCNWASDVTGGFVERNGLENFSAGNTEVDIYLARAAWMEEENATLSTLEYLEVPVRGVDGTHNVEFVLRSWFTEVDPDEVGEEASGEYLVVNLPEEGVRLEFCFASGDYVRVVTDDSVRLYQAIWSDNDISNAEALQGWYYAAAEKAGLKQADTELDGFCGLWYEKIAGRGAVSIEKSIAPGKAAIYARWPGSAYEAATWEITATLQDNQLVYENGVYEVNEYDEDGNSWTTDWSDEESGYFYLNAAGELCWHDERNAGGGDSEFIR